jgi:hypothetical protein
VICDLFATTILVLSSYSYCEPIATVNPATGSIFWRCDCTEARKKMQFVIDETIEKSIDAMIEQRGDEK